jgi:hypothetical protein
MPDLRGARDQQVRDEPLRHGANEIRADHHKAPGEAVCPDTADDHEEDARQGERRQYEAEIRRRSGLADDGERKCDGNERVADRRCGASEPKEPELWLLERAQAAAKLHASTLARANCRRRVLG